MSILSNKRIILVVARRQAYTDSDLWGNEADVLHVGLGHAVNLQPPTLYSSIPN